MARSFVICTSHQMFFCYSGDQTKNSETGRGVWYVWEEKRCIRGFDGEA